MQIARQHVVDILRTAQLPEVADEADRTLPPPDGIYIIRHAEKPLKPPSSGVDYQGGQNEHSLLPRG